MGWLEREIACEKKKKKKQKFLNFLIGSRAYTLGLTN